MRLRSFAWLLLTVLVVSLAAGAAAAWHEGYRLYAVRTGSMAPTFPTGALLVDAPVERPPAVGDVVTFRTSEGLVTHRIHDSTAQGLKTKGDANRTLDAWTVPQRNVIGTVVVGLPVAGYVLVFFQQPTGIASLMLLAFSVWCAWTAFFPADEPAGVQATAPPGDEHSPREGSAVVQLPGERAAAAEGGSVIRLPEELAAAAAGGAVIRLPEQRSGRGLFLT
jgi:signal peptidase